MNTNISSSVDSSIDSLITKLEKLAISDTCDSSNDINLLCNKMSNLIIECSATEKDKYYSKINNILYKLLNKQKCCGNNTNKTLKTIF